MEKVQRANPALYTDKIQVQKLKVKIISQLVAKLVNIFSTPDTIYLQQEDDPSNNINRANNDDDGGDALDTKVEPFMYFIRNGNYTVHVKEDFLAKTSIRSTESDLSWQTKHIQIIQRYSTNKTDCFWNRERQVCNEISDCLALWLRVYL